MTTPDPTGDALKACPHCGGDPHWSPTFIDQDSPGTVSCECGATMICSGEKKVRIAAWNTRTQPVSMDEVEAQTVAALTDYLELLLEHRRHHTAADVSRLLTRIRAKA